MYATQADIETVYSPDALYVADRTEDGVVDADAVDRALQAASAEIDGYVGVRHRLPLDLTNAASAATQLRQYCVDIAVYRLALSRDVLTEEHRRRYEDAIKRLEQISKGTVTLNIPAPVDPDTGEAGYVSAQPIVAGGPERVFTRENMRGM